MITIDIERCTGCGACLEACPTGALYLVDGKAAVDNALCRECEACLQACPSEAITLTLEPVASPLPKADHQMDRRLAQRPEPEVIQVRTETAPVPLRTGILPAVGAALAWAGREIVPRAVDLLLDALDRRTNGQELTAGERSNRAVSQGQGNGGRRHRHRRRGGR